MVSRHFPFHMPACLLAWLPDSPYKYTTNNLRHTHRRFGLRVRITCQSILSNTRCSRSRFQPTPNRLSPHTYILKSMQLFDRPYFFLHAHFFFSPPIFYKLHGRFFFILFLCRFHWCVPHTMYPLLQRFSPEDQYRKDESDLRRLQPWMAKHECSLYVYYNGFFFLRSLALLYIKYIWGGQAIVAGLAGSTGIFFLFVFCCVCYRDCRQYEYYFPALFGAPNALCARFHRTMETVRSYPLPPLGGWG